MQAITSFHLQSSHAQNSRKCAAPFPRMLRPIDTRARASKRISTRKVRTDPMLTPVVRISDRGGADCQCEASNTPVGKLVDGTKKSSSNPPPSRAKWISDFMTRKRAAPLPFSERDRSTEHGRNKGLLPKLAGATH